MFDLVLDKSGHPVIKVSCELQSKDLTEQILKVFLMNAIKNGINIDLVEKSEGPSTSRKSYTIRCNGW